MSVETSGFTDLDRRGVAATWLPSRARALDALVGLGFSVLLVIQLVRHALWRDELNAWGIVLASPGLGDLFAHMHYEGHPALWHLMLWIASKISTAPATLQVVHGFVGLALIWSIAWVSPFGRGEKLLLLLGYFVLFDYTVVSRNYGIGMLLALLYAQRRATHPDQKLRNAGLLGLLANTNVFGLILAGALGVEAVWSHACARAGRPWVAALVLPGALLAGCAALSVATFWPAPDISWRTTGEPLAHGFSFGEIVYVVTNNLSALAPLDVQSFWYSVTAPPVRNYPMLRLLILASGPLVMVLYRRIFARMPGLLVIPGLVFAGSVTFNLLFYEGFVRHWGINFVAFLTILWILRAATREPTPWALPFLGSSAVAGVLFTLQHWTIPFSNAGATADWLRGAGLSDATLIGTPDTHAVAVAELLGRPMLLLDCDCTDTYLRYSDRRDAFAIDQIPARLARAMAVQPTSPAILIDTVPFTPDQERAIAARGLAVTRLAAFTGALNENFYVSRVSVTNPSGGNVPPLAGSAGATR